jgi:hypothetical protein
MFCMFNDMGGGILDPATDYMVDQNFRLTCQSSLFLILCCLVLKGILKCLFPMASAR